MTRPFSIFSVSLLMALTFGSFAIARPARLNTLQAGVARILPGTQVVYRCATCHGSGIARNKFGMSYQKYFVFGFLDPRIKALSDDQKWQELLGLDSDGDGRSNGDEFLAGTHPGVVDAIENPAPRPGPAAEPAALVPGPSIPSSPGVTARP